MSAATFRSLRHRNYRLFFSGQLVSLCGTWIQNVATGWLVWEMTHSAFWLGAIGFLTFLPQLLFSLVGGAAADRFPKRGIIVATQTAAMLLSFAMAALLWTNAITLWMVGAVAFLRGTANSFDIPARQAFVVEMVGKEDLTNAIGLNSAIFNGARLIGPAIGGVVIGLFGTAWCFFLDGASFIAVIAGLLMMRLPAPRIVHLGVSVLRSAKDGLAFIRGERVIGALIVMVSLMTVFGWSYRVLMPLFADDVLHSGAVGLGNLYSANGLGALLSALFVAGAGDRIPQGKVLSAGVAIFVAGIVLFALSQWFWLSMFSLVLVGMGLIAFFATANSMLQGRSPDALRGRVMGWYTVALGGFYPFGSLEVGTFAKIFSAQHILELNALVCAVAALFLLRKMRAGGGRAQAADAMHAVVIE